MADTKIKKAPTQKVSALAAPARSGASYFTAKWKLPSDLFSKKSDHRFAGVKWKWVITLAPMSGKKRTTWTTKTYSTAGSTRTSTTLNLNNITLSNGKTRSLAHFYPNAPRRITNITIKVWGYNSKGDGPVASSTHAIGAPKAPTISALSQAEQTGDVTCTISCDTKANDGYYPRSHTKYWLTVIDTRRTGTARKSVSTATFAGNSQSLTYDVTDRQYLSYSQYVHIKVTAQSRGVGGVGTASPKEIYISWPNQPVIKTKKVGCPKRGKAGKVTIPIDLKKSTEHPVSGVRLQKLVGVTYEKASEIPASAGWENCGVGDDGQCIALSAEVEDVLPEEGTRTWVRVKSWNQIEDIFARYSAPYELSNLYKAAPSAEGDACEIVSQTSTEAGTGAIVVIGFTDDGNTGCEIAWSDDPDAWESTNQPQTFQFTWSDEASKSEQWDRTATVRVEGLTEGEQYYFKARRYLEGESGTTYSSWSAQKDLTPALIPSDVVLSAPGSVRRGNGCEVSWAYSGGKQLSWNLLSNDVVVAQGTDQLGGCSVPAERLEELVGDDGRIPLSVEVTTAGGHASSDQTTIILSDPPTLSLGDVTCTKQPLQIPMTCSDANATVAVTVRAHGCTEAGPGQGDQVEGDVVWSAIVNPSWTAVEEDGAVVGYSFTAEAPTGLDLRDGARYAVTATATDPDTGLTSDEAACGVAVAWEIHAPEPVAEIYPSDVTDEDGIHNISCEIVVGTPETENARDTDLCDIWRVTPDGDYLVQSGVAYDSTVIDPWAPYSSEGGQVAYRVVVRTADGDYEWQDFPYELSAGMLRIDFDGTYVELPYNLQAADSWEKDFESRRKLDGSLDGYFNVGVTRKASFNSEIVRITDADTAARVKALGRYAGACLVRSPDGSCYAAHVAVSDLSWAFTDVLMAVSLDVTELSLTPEYMAIIGGEIEEEE